MIHSSEISMATAVTSRWQEVSLGNRVATRVRRLIPLLTRSMALLVRKQWRYVRTKVRHLLALGTYKR